MYGWDPNRLWTSKHTRPTRSASERLQLPFAVGPRSTYVGLLWCSNQVDCFVGATRRLRCARALQLDSWWVTQEELQEWQSFLWVLNSDQQQNIEIDRSQVQVSKPGLAREIKPGRSWVCFIFLLLIKTRELSTLINKANLQIRSNKLDCVINAASWDPEI